MCWKMCWIYITCELHINNRYNNQYNNKKNKNIWGPKFVFPAFQVQIPRSHVHNPNLKRNCCLVSQKWVITPKGAKLASNGTSNGTSSQWRYLEIRPYRPNLKRNRLKFLHLGPSELSVPKMSLVPNPYFRTENGTSDDASPEISSRQPSLPCPKVMGLGIFGPKNEPLPKIHYAAPTSRILFWAFVAVGAPTES